MYRFSTFLALLLVGCATPYDDLVYQVKKDVQWVDQGAYDQQVYGCRPQGDCDDRALCLACRLVRQGASPDNVIVVIQGWQGANQLNHMSIEYNGHCLLPFGGAAYEGVCEHPMEDTNMRTYRFSLTKYLKHNNLKMECE